MNAARPSAAELTPGKVYARLLRYVRPHWRMFAFGVFGMVLGAVTTALLAWFTGSFLKHAFITPDPRVLWAVPGGILILFLMRGLGDYMATYFPGWVGRQTIKSLRGALFEHYLHLPTRYYDRNSSGPMLSRLTYNVEQMTEASTNSLSVLIRDSLTIIALVGYMLYINWGLTLLALIVAPLIAWLMRGVNRRFRRYSARIQTSMGDVTRVAKEAIEGHRLIKVFTAQEHELTAFESVNEHNRRSHVKLINAKAASNPVVQLVASVGLAVVLYYSISSVLRGQLQLDQFVSFVMAMMLIPASLRQLVNVAGPLQQGIAAGRSVFEVLDEPREASDEQGREMRSLAHARGEVEFRDVTFQYDTGAEATARAAVLTAVSLRIEAGSTVAIVGRSGSGKSTLVSLVPRFYDATAGSVRIDGADVREYRLADLRRQISFVSQDVVLFDDSIRNNIGFAAPGASEAQIEAAAQAAYVLEFTRDLPAGLDTVVGDRGTLLSGGQRQRIAIARALLKNSPILILDEATSALDTESERHIQAALNELVRGRTTLVIAHRLSTVEQADRIVVLNDGRVAESGTHAELIAHDGLYAQLHRLQFNA